MLGVSLAVAVPAAADETADGASLYSSCAVCHLPDGAGIEGSFPPLRDRLGPIASSRAGRDYLVLVLAKGLFGSIEVDGVPYFGAMPGQGLGDAEIAAVLNHVVREFNAETLVSDWAPFTAEEVGRVLSEHESVRANEVRALRGALDRADAATDAQDRLAWMLQCQGCHRADGAATGAEVPAIAGHVARFLSVPRGREYLIRVPGVATAPLADAELASLVNWMLLRFDPENVPEDFEPYGAREVGLHRATPFGSEVIAERARLVAAIQALEKDRDR